MRALSVIIRVPPNRWGWRCRGRSRRCRRPAPASGVGARAGAGPSRRAARMWVRLARRWTAVAWAARVASPSAIARAMSAVLVRGRTSRSGLSWASRRARATCARSGRQGAQQVRAGHGLVDRARRGRRRAGSRRRGRGRSALEQGGGGGEPLGERGEHRRVGRGGPRAGRPGHSRASRSSKRCRTSSAEIAETTRVRPLPATASPSAASRPEGLAQRGPRDAEARRLLHLAEHRAGRRGARPRCPRAGRCRRAHWPAWHPRYGQTAVLYTADSANWALGPFAPLRSGSCMTYQAAGRQSAGATAPADRGTARAPGGGR